MMKSAFGKNSFLLSVLAVSAVLLPLAACGGSNSFLARGDASLPGTTQTQDLSCATGPLYQGTGFNGSVNMLWVDAANCGNVYVSGDFTTYNGTPVGHLVRLLSNGSLDPTFLIGIGPNAHLNAIVPMNDGSGRLYLGGNFTTFSQLPYSYLVRIQANGQLDTTFNLGTGFDSWVFRVLVPNDGSQQLYVTGAFANLNGAVAGKLVRLNSDGSMDTTFALGSGFDGLVQNIALAPQDNSLLYAVGDFLNFNGAAAGHLLRLKHNGAVDTSFQVGVAFTTFESSLFGVTPLTDGTNRLYVTTGGAMTWQGKPIAAGITRLNADGTVDTSFKMGAGFTGIGGTGSYGYVYNVTIANDGSNQVYVAGSFLAVNGTQMSNFARLNADGSVDTTFGLGSGFNNSTYWATLLNDGTGRLYVYGTFQNYQGVTTGGLVRLNADGSLN